MVNIQSVASHQIKSYETFKGGDVLHLETNESTHYSVKTDKQIQVPIADVSEFLHNLKGNP